MTLSASNEVAIAHNRTGIIETLTQFVNIHCKGRMNLDHAGLRTIDAHSFKHGLGMVGHRLLSELGRVGG